MQWLPEQVASILDQQGIETVVFASVDASSDGTEKWLDACATADSRVVVLAHGERFGDAARNFFRLLRDVDFSDFDYVCFSDQDDIWYSDKLARACQKLTNTQAAVYSSNVMAFWPDGRRLLIDKAQPQQRWDFLFEAAGPGCTYVMDVEFAKAMQRQLAKFIAIDAALPAHHDWFCYALCRARGDRWVIDPVPSMDYRQHGGNEVGVNEGMKASQTRVRKVASGWYRQEVLKMARITMSVRPADQKLMALTNRLERGNWLDRIILAYNVHHLRRRMRDRLVLAMLFLSGLFFQRRS
jgi:rhamnosyltransferase